MSIIQEQIQKYLTIDELMPTWSHFLDLYLRGLVEEACRFRDKNDINMINPSRCFVGEAWKFTDDYGNTGKFGCLTCKSFSYGTRSFVIAYDDIIKSSGLNWREHPMIQEFVQHFNEQHINKT